MRLDVGARDGGGGGGGVGGLSKEQRQAGGGEEKERIQYCSSNMAATWATCHIASKAVGLSAWGPGAVSVCSARTQCRAQPGGLGRAGFEGMKTRVLDVLGCMYRSQGRVPAAHSIWLGTSCRLGLMHANGFSD